MDQYQELDEAILTITTGDNWQKFLTILNAEAGAAMQTEMEAETMEDIKYQRGYRAALLFVANIREVTKTLIQQAEHQNADV